MPNIKTSLLILLSLGTTLIIPAQTGINTKTPKATLDIQGNPADPTSIDGFLAPRISGPNLQRKNSLYKNEQIGTIVYVTSKSPQAGNMNDKTEKVTGPGYYYYDGSLWLQLINSDMQASSNIKANNGLSKYGNNIQLGGALISPTTISNISNSNKLEFTGNGIDAVNFFNNTLSINANDNRIGIGTPAPKYSLDIEGTLRLSNSISDNKPRTLTQSTPSYINSENGQIVYAPKGFPSVVGGFRPGAIKILAKLPTSGTIVRIRFVCHVHSSSPENQVIKEAYTYGDLVIVGMDTANPIKFVETQIKDFNGDPKKLVTNSATEISWNNYSQGITTLTINQSTGEFKIATIYKENTKIETLSYLFEFFGGM